MMPLKTMIMKYTNSKFTAAIIAIFCTVGFANAQEIIKDTVKTKPVSSSFKKQKVDGVIATVGDYIILDSDIDKTYLELSSQGNSIKDITRCQMLGKLLEDKLYAHQAVQDSIIVKDEEIKEKLNEQVNYMVEQLGSMDKVVQYFKKSNEDEFRNEIDMDEHTHEGKVETFGKVAKFPKNVKASKAYNFLENVKVSKKSIWYIMVEKQDNELQMVKYNYKEGVDLTKFVNELKTYYSKKYSNEPKLQKLVESIYVDGNDKYSMIRNIPALKLDNRLLITTITEDLIKLLSK